MILKRVNFESWTNLFSSKKIHFSLKIIRVYKVTLWSKIQFRQIMWLLYALNIWIKGKKIYTKTKQIHQRTDFNYSVLRCTSYSMGFWFNFVIYTIRMRFFVGYGTSCSIFVPIYWNKIYWIIQSKLRHAHFFLILSNYNAKQGWNHSEHHEFSFVPSCSDLKSCM